MYALKTDSTIDNIGNYKKCFFTAVILYENK